MIRAKFRTISVLVFVLLISSISVASEPEIQGQRLLAALGGEAAWKNARAVRNKAINHHPQARLPYIQEYWYYTEYPQHVVKINNYDLDRMRQYSESGGWSLVEGDLRPFSQERLENELNSWHRSMYRKIYLLARQSPDLRLARGSDGSLEFYEAGNFIGWMMVDDQGNPRGHGSQENRDIYTNFEELVEFGNIRWPRGGEDETGWRFEMLEIEVLDSEPELSLEPPTGG